jgi:hypothetical protein
VDFDLEVAATLDFFAVLDFFDALAFEALAVADLPEVRGRADFCRAAVRVAAADSAADPGPKIQKIDVRATRRNSNERGRLEIMRAPVSSLAGHPAVSRVSAL